MVAIHTSTDRAPAVRATVASGSALLVGSQRCAIYPVTMIRTSMPRFTQRPRQTERVAEAARNVPGDGWSKAAGHGPVVRRIPMNDRQQAVEAGITTECMRRGTERSAWA